MTQKEKLVSTFRDLPENEQLDVTMAFLKELAKSKIPLLDESERAFLDERIQAADKYPEQLIPAEEVFRGLLED
ncbi:MAG: addiction module protein [Planctomycetota bacterium]|nr:addiction module protein [Planctomycetota bacterium]